MLAFITSVRHPQNSSDYGRVEELLRRTLTSVCAQTCPDFVVVVVCNQVPSGTFDERVEFVTVDFPPPSSTAGPETGREAVLQDKGTKLAVALLAAQRHSPDYVMKFDADDFVSRRLVEFTRDSDAAGWYVEDGYVVSATTRLISPCTDFNGQCGTSEIVANRLYPLPAELPPLDASQDEVLQALGSELVRDLLGSHRHSREFFDATGHPLVPVPFPAAVYTVGTGENHSGRTRTGSGKPITGELAEEFSIGHLRSPRAWWWWARRTSRGALRRARRLLPST